MSEDISVSGGTLMTVIADAEVTSLGFSPQGVPPSDVTVAVVVEDGWVARHGVAVDDTLVSIGLMPTSELTKADIQHHLQQRPVRLTFLRPATVGKQEFDLDVQLAEVLAKIAAAKKALLAAADEVETFDSILHYDGVSSTGSNLMTAEVLTKEAREALVALSSLVDADMFVNMPRDAKDQQEDIDSGDLWPSKEDLPYTLEAAVGVRALGFVVAGKPPARISVKKVMQDGWAERHGLEERDVLLLLEEDISSDLSKEDIQERMRKRPLKLTFLREYDSGRPPPAADRVIEAVQILGRALTSPYTLEQF